jgi:hypothetical protein
MDLRDTALVTEKEECRSSTTKEESRGGNPDLPL